MQPRRHISRSVEGVRMLHFMGLTDLLDLQTSWA
jgi:hypothetical protein